jgi:hypothetical protein
MNIRRTASLAAAALLLCAATKPGISWTRIASGTNSGITEQDVKLILCDKDWRELWTKHTSYITPPPPPPKVDFTKQSVVAAFGGQKKSGGYSVKITEIAPKGSNGIGVRITATEPPAGALTTEDLTQPFDIVKVNARPTGPMVVRL